MNKKEILLDRLLTFKVKRLYISHFRMNSKDFVYLFRTLVVLRNSETKEIDSEKEIPP